MRLIRWFSNRLCRTMLRISCLVLVLESAAVVMIKPFMGMLFGLFIGWRRYASRSFGGGGWAYGTAAWADSRMLVGAGMLGEHGLILGRNDDARPSKKQAVASLFNPRVDDQSACDLAFDAMFRTARSARRLIRLPYNDFVHIGTFAPAGKGKGTGNLIPNLLSYPFSCVVTDPKGELWEATALHRQRMGHRCIKLDPFNVTGQGGSSFNPLAWIEPTATDFLDQCRDLANMLVVRPASEKDPHWSDCAEMVLTAMIAFVCACEQDPTARSFQTIRDLLSSRKTFMQVVEAMQATEGFDGVIASLGGQLTWFEGKELNSVLTTTMRHTSFFDSPAVRACTATSSFDPTMLRKGRMTIYLILPPERLVSLSALMRMWIGSILRLITRGKASEKNKVLFFLDEAAHLGRIQVLEDAVTLMRGYGIRLWFFFQSTSQINECYGEHASKILDNLDTQIYMGLNTFDAAEAVSKRIGDTTVGISTVNDTSGWSSSRSGGWQPNSATSGSSGSTSVNYSEVARRLIKPEEIITLGGDATIIFHRNLKPILGRRIEHFRDREFARGRGGRQGGVGLSGHFMAAALLAASLVFGALLIPAVRMLDSPQLARWLDEPSPVPLVRRKAGYSPFVQGGAFARQRQHQR